MEKSSTCLLYTSDAADERSSVDLGGRRIIKKKKTKEEDSGLNSEKRRLRASTLDNTVRWIEQAQEHVKEKTKIKEQK